MLQRMLRFAGLLGLGAISVIAQPGQVAGPISGFVFDRAAGSLRPILGIPGASVIGDPLQLGYGVASAAVSPAQDSALAFATDGSLHFLRLSAGAASETKCAVCPSTANAAFFSPSGTAVALYSAGHVQILTGLPGAPAMGATFTVGTVTGTASRGTRVLSSAPPPMALSDDGLLLLAGTHDAVELFNANGGTQSLIGTLPYPLMAFAAGGHDAVVADPKVGVVLFHDVAGAAAQQSLASGGAVRTRKFNGVAFSPDGSHVLTTTAGDASVVSVEVASGTAATTQCGCAPEELAPMGSMLRLNEMGSGPIWLVDGRSAQPSVVFVPALVAAQ